MIRKYLAWRYRRRLIQLKRDLAKKQTELAYLSAYTNVGTPKGKRHVSVLAIEHEAQLAGDIAAHKRDVQEIQARLSILMENAK